MARALLLSGPHGLGHEMPVRSLRAWLAGAGWSVRTLDSIALLGSGAARAGQRAFDALLTVPGIYDGLHFAHLRAGSGLARAMDGAAARRTVPALRAELGRDPADLVLSVFATGAGAAAGLRRSAPATAPPAVVYCPDVGVHRLWVHAGTDLFLVCSPAAAAAVRRFRPRAPVAVVPPPVRAAFYDAPSQPAARERLGVPAGARCALLIDSGWGFAPLAEAAAALADAGVHVLAVAGRSRRTERELRAAARGRPRLIPFGFTDQVPALIAASDLVVSLPGATICSEARVVGRPLLLLDVMPGHGRDNLLHELERGGAGTCGPRGADIAASARAILDQARLDAAPGPVRRAPRWEPAWAAALARVGLDVPAGQPPAVSLPAGSAAPPAPAGCPRRPSAGPAS